MPAGAVLWPRHPALSLSAGAETRALRDRRPKRPYCEKAGAINKALRAVLGRGVRALSLSAGSGRGTERVFRSGSFRAGQKRRVEGEEPAGRDFPMPEGWEEACSGRQQGTDHDGGRRRHQKTRADGKHLRPCAGAETRALRDRRPKRPYCVKRPGELSPSCRCRGHGRPVFLRSGFGMKKRGRTLSPSFTPFFRGTRGRRNRPSRFRDVFPRTAGPWRTRSGRCCAWCRPRSRRGDSRRRSASRPWANASALQDRRRNRPCRTRWSTARCRR